MPVLFILHNIEEFLGFDKMKAIMSNTVLGGLYQKEQFLTAIVILSIIVAVLFWLNYRVNSRIFNYTIFLISIAIGINAIFHLVGSLKAWELLPGVITAVFIFFYDVVFIRLFLKEIRIEKRSLLLFLIIGFCVMIIAIVAALLAGKLISYI
jgi:hypothetical protein